MFSCLCVFENGILKVRAIIFLISHYQLSEIPQNFLHFFCLVFPALHAECANPQVPKHAIDLRYICTSRFISTKKSTILYCFMWNVIYFL